MPEYRKLAKVLPAHAAGTEGLSCLALSLAKALILPASCNLLESLVFSVSATPCGSYDKNMAISPLQLWPGFAWPGLVRPGQAKPGLASSCLAWPGVAWPDLLKQEYTPCVIKYCTGVYSCFKNITQEYTPCTFIMKAP